MFKMIEEYDRVKLRLIWQSIWITKQKDYIQTNHKIKSSPELNVILEMRMEIYNSSVIS